jgi:hypothetical protein
MNLWIEKTPKELAKVLKLANVFVINDSEARQLSGEHNLVKGAKKIIKMMPKGRGVPSAAEGTPLLKFFSISSLNRLTISSVSSGALPPIGGRVKIWKVSQPKSAAFFGALKTPPATLT